MQGQLSEDVWSRFVFELVWPKEVTLVSRTQPSGPLCLWQCFYIVHLLTHWLSICCSWHTSDAFPKGTEGPFCHFLHFFPSRHAMIKIKPFLAIALNVASKREQFHPLWVFHLLCLNCAQCCSWTMTWWQRLILWMKLPIFFEIQFRLLPQDGNLTLFHHLTKEPKKRMGRQKIW